MEFTSVMNEIRADDKVHFIYKRYDTHGFACSYIFRSYFKERNELDKLTLAYVSPGEDLNCPEQSIVFLCDVDIDYNILSRLRNKARYIVIIDSKYSTTQVLFNQIKDKEKDGKAVVQVLCMGKEPPINIVWSIIHGFKQKPKYVEDISNSYLTEYMMNITGKGNNFLLLKYQKHNYDHWDLLVNDEFYLADHESLVNAKANLSLVTATNICFRNAIPYSLLGHKVLLINANKELMDEVGILTIASEATSKVDLAIVYERTFNGYYYSVYTSEKCNVNLLEVFKEFNCFGFHRRAWFFNEKFIFEKRKSFFKKLKELFLS